MHDKIQENLSFALLHLGKACCIKVISILTHIQSHQKLINSFMQKDIAREADWPIVWSGYNS